MKEIWKDIPGYEGYYQSSNLGKIRSLDRVVTKSNGVLQKVKGIVLKQQYNTHGYCVVFLYKNKIPKQKLVSRIIYKTFKESFFKNMVIDHIDNDRTNNKIENLQQINQRKNTSKDKIGYTSKYTGVSWDKLNNKWLANIHIEGITKNLGRFDSEEKAHFAYQKALMQI